MFREFTEFPNPEEVDYDITSSQGMGEINQYSMEILDMVGFLEDGEHVIYGITEEEYLHPTQETVDKIRAYLENNNIEPITPKSSKGLR